MKKTIKNAFRLKAMLRIAGIVALSALIGFSMAACGDDSGGDNNPVGGAGSGNSTLTITGLSRGDYTVWVYAAGTDISSWSAYSSVFTSEQAAGATSSNRFSNSISLWEQGQDGQPPPPWRGSGNREVAVLSGTTGEFYYATVNFSNGSATVPWSSFRQITHD